MAGINIGEKAASVPGYAFGLNQAQVDKLKDWQATHALYCPWAKLNDEGRYEEADKMGKQLYIFSHSSGIGQSAEFKCGCGDTVDITDYDNW